MPVHDRAVERPFLELDGEAYVAVLASPLFYELAAAGASIQVVADLAVEWDGTFDLLLTWDEIQRLIDDLVLSWQEVPQPAILNGDLTLTWIELETLDGLLLTWPELPAGLLDAYELDPQRPYGRMTKGV